MKIMIIIVSKSWVVYHQEIVAKLTSAAVFTAAEDLALEESAFEALCRLTSFANVIY